MDVESGAFWDRNAAGEMPKNPFFRRLEFANRLFINDLAKFLIAVPWIKIVVMDGQTCVCLD
jgi:hypothetical protein